MIEKNLKTSEFLSEESEDYSFDDIIQLHKIDQEEEFKEKVQVKNLPPTPPSTMPAAIKPLPTLVSSSNPGKPIDYNENVENSAYDLRKIKDIESVLKKISNILGTRVSNNINRFSNMTYNEALLKDLYRNLENISKSRGNAKEIIEIGARIESVETEKQRQFIDNDEINKTVEDIKSIVSLLAKFQYMLENRPS